MVSRKELFESCRSDMESADIDTARFDTLCMFQDVLKETVPMLRPDETVPDEAEETLRNMTKRRCQGEPLQYILGEWEFYGLPFKVGEGVLIPRPDTETLVDQVIDICRERGLSSPRIADLCSGSGCIAVALKKQLPEAEIWAVEISDKAYGYLCENTALNGTDIHTVKADVLKKETAGMFSGLDIIVSNPPYLTSEEMNDLQREVACEPGLALFGGSDGLGFYRAISQLWRRSLKNDGVIAFEFGMDQHDQVASILSDSGFSCPKIRRDTQGIIRTVSAVKSSTEPQYIDNTV